jgi:hypothetical protein
MKFSSTLLILSLLGILILAIIQARTEPLEKGTISSVEYSQKIVKINLEENKTLIIFTSKILNLKKGDSIAFKENKGFSSDKEEILLDKLWKIK